MAKLTLCLVINGGVSIFAANCMQAAKNGPQLNEDSSRLGMQDVMTFLFRSSPKQWYQQTGLVNDVIFLIIFGGLGPLFSVLIDKPQLWGLMQAARVDLENTDMTVSDYNKLHEPSEPELGFWTADALKTFIIAVAYSPLIPFAPLCSGCLLVVYYWATKYSLLRIKKRSALILGPKLAVQALIVVRGFVSLVLPALVVLFLCPSLTKDTSKAMVFSMEVLFLILFMNFLFPVAAQRRLIQLKGKLEKMYGQEGQKETHLADIVDYYEAQHAWPSEWKYRKSHVLYKALPEDLNPETLHPGDQRHDLADAIEKYFKEAVEQAIFDTETFRPSKRFPNTAYTETANRCVPG
eukprot:gnl/MRDRNA2_/MRDRNA2_201657_c0_seq1.p1 gnl/MRDRNA2_/MRDRNA2_201657_c0~~gnl/MRDRNA2_/MRDRNA2_201657_c0_seq1.p1  ORF type:complete len:363 (+),score=63.59 gnl/MRDRNA2_/MRDRNA2_201657_c0_seq1:41-1090(+)